MAASSSANGFTDVTSSEEPHPDLGQAKNELRNFEDVMRVSGQENASPEKNPQDSQCTYAINAANRANEKWNGNILKSCLNRTRIGAGYHHKVSFASELEDYFEYAVSLTPTPDSTQPLEDILVGLISDEEDESEDDLDLIAWKISNSLESASCGRLDDSPQLCSSDSSGKRMGNIDEEGSNKKYEEVIHATNSAGKDECLATNCNDSHEIKDGLHCPLIIHSELEVVKNAEMAKLEETTVLGQEAAQITSTGISGLTSGKTDVCLESVNNQIDNGMLGLTNNAIFHSSPETVFGAPEQRDAIRDVRFILLEIIGQIIESVPENLISDAFQEIPIQIPRGTTTDSYAEYDEQTSPCIFSNPGEDCMFQDCSDIDSVPCAQVAKEDEERQQDVEQYSQESLIFPLDGMSIIHDSDINNSSGPMGSQTEQKQDWLTGNTEEHDTGCCSNKTLEKDLRQDTTTDDSLSRSDGLMTIGHEEQQYDKALGENDLCKGNSFKVTVVMTESPMGLLKSRDIKEQEYKNQIVFVEEERESQIDKVDDISGSITESIGDLLENNCDAMRHGVEKVCKITPGSNLIGSESITKIPEEKITSTGQTDFELSRQVEENKSKETLNDILEENPIKMNDIGDETRRMNNIRMVLNGGQASPSIDVVQMENVQVKELNVIKDIFVKSVNKTETGMTEASVNNNQTLMEFTRRRTPNILGANHNVDENSFELHKFAEMTDSPCQSEGGEQAGPRSNDQSIHMPIQNQNLYEEVYDTHEEIYNTCEEIHSTDEEIHNPQDAIHSSHEEIYSSHKGIHNTHKGIHSSQEEIHSSQEEIHNTHKDIHSSQEEIHSSQEEIHNTHKDIHSSQEEIHCSQDEIHSSQGEIHNTHKDIDSSQEEIHSSQKEIHSTHEDVHITHKDIPDTSVEDQGLHQESLSVEDKNLKHGKISNDESPPANLQISGNIPADIASTGSVDLPIDVLGVDDKNGDNTHNDFNKQDGIIDAISNNVEQSDETVAVSTTKGNMVKTVDGNGAWDKITLAEPEIGYGIPKNISFDTYDSNACYFDAKTGNENIRDFSQKMDLSLECLSLENKEDTPGEFQEEKMLKILKEDLKFITAPSGSQSSTISCNRDVHESDRKVPELDKNSQVSSTGGSTDQISPVKELKRPFSSELGCLEVPEKAVKPGENTLSLTETSSRVLKRPYSEENLSEDMETVGATRCEKCPCFHGNGNNREMLEAGAAARVYEDQAVPDTRDGPSPRKPVLNCHLEVTDSLSLYDDGKPDGKLTAQSVGSFKWSYAPSVDFDSGTVLDDTKLEDQEPQCVPRIQPLNTCRRPLRVGLSKRFKSRPLHPNYRHQP